MISVGEHEVQEDARVHQLATALLQAAAECDVEQSEHLLQDGDKANIRNEADETPLHFAARHDSVAIAQLLIDSNAEIDATTAAGATPLHYAAQSDAVNSAKLLISRGAAVTAREQEFEDTPLHVAAKSKAAGVCALLLDDANVDVSATNRAGSVEVVKLLLNHGANIRDTMDTSGDTLLHLAVSVGVDMVELLLEHGAAVNASNSSGDTPLHCALFESGCDVVQLLISNGADVNALNNASGVLLQAMFGGNRLLQSSQERLEFLRYLVESGFNLSEEETLQCDDESVPVGELTAITEWIKQRNNGLHQLTALPVEVFDRGPRDIEIYFKAVYQTKKSLHDFVQYRSKVCVVGPSKWGKTSFIKTFTSNQATLEEEDQRTIGIDLFTWKFDTTTNHADEEYTVTLWDFAGQDEYQSAHTLFFSRRTLYVLCVNLQAYAQALEQSETTDDPDAAMDEFVEMHLYHWVRVICAHFPESKFVFVGTKLDLIGFDTDKVRAITGDLLARIATKEQDVLDAIERDIEALNEETPVDNTQGHTLFRAVNERKATLEGMKKSRPQFLSTRIHTISSADRHGIDELRLRLEQYVVQSGTGFAMPPIYAQLHAHLRDKATSVPLSSSGIKEVVNNTFIAVPTLLNQLQEQEAFAAITADELTAMMHVFHDLGDLLWFDSDPTNSLVQTVFLSPVVVIDFIRQVINHTLGDPKHARTKAEKELYAIVRDEGRVTNSLVRKLDLWKDMSNDTMAQLKELLYQFQLAYPAGKGGMKWDSDLIVPLYWKKKPQSERGGEIPTADASVIVDMKERCHWEYVFRVYLPENLFEKLGVQSYSAHYSCDRQFRHDGFETTMDNAYHTRVLRKRVEVEGSTVVALAIEVYAVQRDEMWEQLIWHALNLEKLLETFPGLWVTRQVVTTRGKRLELNKLVEQEQELRATADMIAHGKSRTSGSGLLPPNMDCPMEAIVVQVVGRIDQVAARIEQAREELKQTVEARMDKSNELFLEGLASAKGDLLTRMDANKDALMTMSAGDDNRRLYPALWTLEYQTSAAMKTTTLIMKIRSDLSGKCFHEPLEITVGDKFFAQYGTYIKGGLSLFASAVPDVFGKGIFDVIASECTKQVDRAITLHNIVQGLDLSPYGATDMESTRTLMPDETLLMFRDLLLFYDPTFEPLRMSQVCKLECGIVRSTGEYIWAHRSEIESRLNSIRFKHDYKTNGGGGGGNESLPSAQIPAGDAGAQSMKDTISPEPALNPKATTVGAHDIVGGHMVLTIVEVRNLRNVRLVGKQSPYCEWRMLSARDNSTIAQGSTSKHVGGGCSPNWSDQHFRIDLSKSAAANTGYLLLLQVKCVGIVPMVK
ncbi:TPA: hypothetical protein N0F65_004177 [Lagenidium giganteum]|uniref:Non-specific serine/threonine protein kinase n=1 Tax=Lagenidium giganteum TaxID=4803 RepID=A0AAV2YKB1_9STRA|nr:TPA: hypothetical protein N0F65_004177 [Lagenidium giganteum]